MQRNPAVTLPVGLVLAGLLAGALLAWPGLSSQFFDDAYIHARLTEHLLAGDGPVFNPGEHHKIGSSTGYLYLLAGLSPFTGLPEAMRYLGMFAVLLTCAGLAWLAGNARLPRPLALLSAVAIIPYLLLAAYGGMETPLACLLLTASAIAARLDRPGPVIALAALGVWLRFELILFVALALFHYLVRERRTPALLWYALPLPCLFLLEYQLYGSILPHAAGVKMVAYGMPLHMSFLRALSLGGGHGSVVNAVIAVLLLTAFSLHGINLLLRWRRPAVADIYLVFSAGVLFAWCISRSLIFEWYFALLLFPFGLHVLLDHDRGGRIETPTRYSRALLLAAGFALGLQQLMTPLGLSARDQSTERVPRYLEIGTALHDHCPSCTLLTSEVGGLGYGFKGRVYDAFGLGDPAAARFHPLAVPQQRRSYGIGAIPPDYVRFRDPDFIVSMPVFSEALRRSGVLTAYTGYDCPFAPHVLAVFGDRVVQIHARTVLPAGLVESLRCSAHTTPAAE